MESIHPWHAGPSAQGSRARSCVCHVLLVRSWFDLRHRNLLIHPQCTLHASGFLHSNLPRSMPQTAHTPRRGRCSAHSFHGNGPTCLQKRYLDRLPQVPLANLKVPFDTIMVSVSTCLGTLSPAHAKASHARSSTLIPCVSFTWALLIRLCIGIHNRKRFCRLTRRYQWMSSILNSRDLTGCL